ncbi:MAG: tetraacyldisaccharide 4'-kinase [Acidobacteriota bacterium]
MLSALYAAVARRRRERFVRRPDLRRRLRRPVISVGNLAVGGRGKTPLVATIARELLAMGERPAILTRGYGRTRPEDGIVVVRDPEGIRSDLARAGDEPLMLARQLAGVSVLASPDRYLAGRLAEHHFGATVHLLDDGFQHLQLDRDLDIVMVGRDDIARPVTLPRGRLREPLDALIVADAILTSDADVVIEMRGADTPIFSVVRRLAAPAEVPSKTAVLALAGIAGPDRFFDDLTAADFQVVGTRAFPDHHPYSNRDVAGIYAEARAAGAHAVLTTEKDYVRLLRFRPFPMLTDWVPLTIEPDPLPDFRRWLAGSLGAARDSVG